MELERFVSENISASSEEKSYDLGVDFNFFKNNDKAVIASNDSEAKRKNSNKKIKVSIETPDGKEILNPVKGSDVAETDYAGSYTETNRMLRQAIMQADELSGEIKSDIESVRSSKTIKNKYTYVTNLTASAGSLISTKINAIREMNNSITQSHNLELNRMKALKTDADKDNDEMKMMDIYSAFVNTPVGNYVAPSIQDITLGVNSNNSNINAVEMVNPSSNQKSSLTPEQIRMRMESNPNIEVVVRYNQSTGQRCFDVIDKQTGSSIQDYPRPDAFLLEDTTIDVHSGIARNRNINTVWPLIIDGSSGSINEY